MASERPSQMKSTAEQIYILSDMQLDANSYIRSISWYNEFPSRFTFFILEELDLEPRRFSIVDKLFLISPKVDKKEKFWFPKPFFVAAKHHVGIIFPTKKPAFGWGQTHSSTQTIITTCHGIFDKNTVIFAKIGGSNNRS